MTRRTFGPGRLTGRQLADDAGPVIVLALMVLLVAGMFAAAPAVMSRIATDEIQHSVQTVSPTDRFLMTKSSQAPALGPADEGADLADVPADVAELWGGLLADLAAGRAAFPGTLADVVGPARFTVTSDDIPIPDAGTGRTGLKFLAFTVDPFLSHHLQLLEGRWPERTGDDTIEVALGKPAAADFGWRIGQDRVIDDAAGSRTVKLVGLLGPNPGESDYGRMMPFATESNVFDDGNAPARYTGTAYLHPSMWKAQGHTLNASTAIWFPISTDAITDADLEQIAADLRRVSLVEIELPSATGVTDALDSVKLRTELPAALDAAAARVRSASSVQTIAMLGPAGAALAVLALGLQSFVRRREPAVALLVSRGASLRQVRRSMAVQGLVIGLPAALIGVLVMRWWFGAAMPWWAWLLGLLAGLIPALVLPTGVSEKRLRTVRSDFGTAAGSTRWVVEIVVLALAGLSLYLLLSGGLTRDSGGADVIVAAAPVLLTLAVCVVVIRLYPLALRGVQGLLRRGRGAVGFLGAVRALRDPLVGVPLVLATVTGVAVAVFSMVTLSTVNTGIDVASQRQVGADFRVTGAWMTDEVTAEVRAIPGVRQASPAGIAGPVTLESDSGPIHADMFFAETDSFSQVLPDIPGIPEVPPGMADKTDAGHQAVVSTSVAAALSGPVTIDGENIDIVGTGEYSTGLSNRTNWVLVTPETAEELGLNRATADRLLVAAEPGANPGELEAQLREVIGDRPGLIVQSPANVADSLRAAPTIAGMQIVLLAATVLGVLLVALAVLVTAVSGTRVRQRLLSVLRVLGLSRRQVAQLASWEQAPPALTAVLIGGVFGVGLAALVRGVVDLRAFTGGSAQPEVTIRAVDLVLVIGGFAVVIAAAIAVSALLARRAGSAAGMRTEE